MRKKKEEERKGEEEDKKKGEKKMSPPLIWWLAPPLPATHKISVLAYTSILLAIYVREMYDMFFSISRTGILSKKMAMQ